jgi:hypothetical protein
MGKILLKFGLALIILMVIMVITAVLLFSIYAPRYFLSFVQEEVQQSTNGRYVLLVDSHHIKIHLSSMSFNLGMTEFKRDSTVEAYSGVELLDKFDIYASFESFNIGAFQLVNFVRNKRINVREIALNQPTVIIRKNALYSPSLQDDSLNLQDSTSMTYLNAVPDSTLEDSLAWYEFQQAGNNLFPPVRVDDISVEDASFSFYGAHKKYPMYMVRGLDFKVKDYLFTEKGKRKMEHVSIKIDTVSSLVSENIARLNLKDVYIQPDSMHIGGLHYGHIVNKSRINEIKGFRASWFQINAENIHLAGMDVAQMISDSVYIVNRAVIGDLRLYLYKDKHEPVINPEHKPLPAETIRNIPVPFQLDTLQVENGLFIIEMLAPKAFESGQITLNQFQAQILNITNIPESLAVDPAMALNAEFKVMDKVQLNVNARFDLNSDIDEFTFETTAEPFDIAILNGFLGSQLFIEFSSGHIDNLSFQFVGNNKANVGTLDLAYSKLRVRKLKDYEIYLVDNPKTGLLAGLGNMIMRNNLSLDDNHYKPGVIYYEKEYNRDFIHGTIMSLLSGATSSMGLTSRNLEKKQDAADNLDESDTKVAEEKALDDAEKATEERESNENNQQ